MNTLLELLDLNEEPQHVPLVEALEESVKSLNLQHKGGKVNVSNLKGAGALFKANPKLVTGSAVLALNAYDKNSKHQRHLLRLHAKSPMERKMIKSIVDALTDKGQYKVRRIRFEKGGRTWELARKR